MAILVLPVLIAWPPGVRSCVTNSPDIRYMLSSVSLIVNIHRTAFEIFFIVVWT